MTVVLDTGALDVIWLVSPHPGDIAVVLPDDEASLSDAMMYRKRGQLLFSYEPRPPTAMVVLVGRQFSSRRGS